MAAQMSSEVRADPNLTPMLDMVFQLITFFVLVVNFKSAELDLTLKLPVVGSARPVETMGTKELLVLNMDSNGDLRLYGRVIPNVDGYIRNEAMASMLAARMTTEDIAAGEDLPTTVVIRADRATSFKMVNRVIQLCRKNGYLRFAFRAVAKDD